MLELPDFLKVGQSADDSSLDQMCSNENGGFPLRRTELHNSDSSIRDLNITSRLSRMSSRSQEDLNDTQLSVDSHCTMDRSLRCALGSPASVSSVSLSNKLPFMDRSFSKDGVMPSHKDAENYFSNANEGSNSPDFNDSRIGDISLRDIGFNITSSTTDLLKQANKQAIRPMVPRRRLPPRPVDRLSTDSSSVQPSTPAGRRLPPLPKVPADMSYQDTEVADFPPPTPLSGDSRDNKPVPRPRNLADSGDNSVPTPSSSSIPSPTTHDLVLFNSDSSPDSPRKPAINERPTPPPRARKSPKKTDSESTDSDVRQALEFETEQISYV
jgi:hypothetical protein